MKFKLTRLLFFTVLLLLHFDNSVSNDNQRNPYNLDLISSPAEYKQSVIENPDNAMLDLKEIIPNAVFDIVYAGTNNFTGKQIYDSPEAYLRKPAALALKKVNDRLNSIGYTLIIRDAYRPYSASLKFFEVFPDTNFVANPKFGSRHNRACAVDVSLAKLSNLEEVDVPTMFDDFSEKAHPDYSDISNEAAKNRNLLIEVMKEFGFTVYPTEWWHFDYRTWENFKLMDIHFDELD